MYPKELVKVELFKVFNETQNHHGFQYQEGVVNHLKESFVKTGSCVRGGFYFTTKEHISVFLSLGVRIRRVHVPFDHPDVQVVRDPSGDKYRTNMLILGKKCAVEELFSMIPLPDLLGWVKATDRSEILNHWNDLGNPGISEISMDDASDLGLVGVLEWRKNSGFTCKWSADAMDWSGENGHVHILEWWKNTELQSKIAATRLPKALKCKWSHVAMNVASSNGQVEVLEWWKNSEWECKWSEHAMDGASQFGHVEVLEWWKNSGLECKWTERAMDEASSNGHIQVLEWWKKSTELQSKIAATRWQSLKCKWYAGTVNRAKRKGHVEVVEWWKKEEPRLLRAYSFKYRILDCLVSSAKKIGQFVGIGSKRARKHYDSAEAWSELRRQKPYHASLNELVRKA